jgi:hypothetical protein
MAPTLHVEQELHAMYRQMAQVGAGLYEALAQLQGRCGAWLNVGTIVYRLWS